jgi:hypothetical protein
MFRVCTACSFCLSGTYHKSKMVCLLLVSNKFKIGREQVAANLSTHPAGNSFCFDMNLFLWQYIRVQCLTSLFMCRLLLELTLVESLVGKSTHSLDPCCLEHLGCCFCLLFFHRYRLFLSWCSYFMLYTPTRLRSGRQTKEIAEDELGKENKKEGRKG